METKVFEVKFSPSELLSAAKTLIQNKFNFMVVGSVGIGKTSICYQAAQEVCERVIVETPHLKEPTDYHGYPFAVSDKKADFLPLGTLYEIIYTDKRTHVIFDELDKCTLETASAVAQLILQREVNGIKISDKVSFSATGNRRCDGAGSNVLPTHLIDRFTCIMELEQNIDDWSLWALEQGYPIEFISFNRFKPEYILSKQDRDKARELIKSPTPRSLAGFADLLKAGVKDTKILASCAGVAYAVEYLSFLETFCSLPSLDVILSPEYQIPSELSAQFALLGYAAKNVTKNRMKSFMNFVKKFDKPMEIMCVVTAVKYNKELANTPEYANWIINNKWVVTQ